MNMTTPQNPRSIDAIIDSIDGGPAFPQPQGKDENGVPYSAREIPGDSGMSLRDWFAGMALQGVIAKHPTRYSPTGDPIDMEIALGAYDYADAMLAARKGDA